MGSSARRLQKLTDENALLLEKVSGLESLIKQLADENRWMKEQFLLARHKQFGAKSERITIDPTQLGPLFNEAEAVLHQSHKEALDEKTITYTRRKKSVGHREEVLECVKKVIWRVREVYGTPIIPLRYD